MTCSECGADNARHAHIYDIETRSPGSFRRMRRGFRCLLIYAILVLVFSGLMQLLGLSANIMAMNAMVPVMGFFFRVDDFLEIAYPLLLFLAAAWFTARGAWEGHLSQALIKTCRMLFLLQFVFVSLPFLGILFQVLQWPGEVERWVDNSVNFMNRYGWLIAQVSSYAFMAAKIIFVFLCMRSAGILKAQVARGWFRICFFFLLAELILKLPGLFFLVAGHFDIIDYFVANSGSPPRYVVVLSWIGLLRFYVFLAATAFLLMGSLRIVRHMRILVPRQTPLHQDGEAA